MVTVYKFKYICSISFFPLSIQVCLTHMMRVVGCSCAHGSVEVRGRVLEKDFFIFLHEKLKFANLRAKNCEAIFCTQIRKDYAKRIFFTHPGGCSQNSQNCTPG